MFIRMLTRAGAVATAVLLAALCTPGGAAAQLASTEAARIAARGVTIPPRVPLDAATELGAMEIDGALDEPEWQDAQVFTGFTQREPVEGEPAQNDTEVRVLLGDGAVWIGARMWDSEPDRIVARLTRRDNEGTHDEFGVLFDPNLDGLTGYGFLVNAANVQRDIYFYDDANEDNAWDAVWVSEVRIDSDGWTAEMRIPLSQIRYEASELSQAWGINFYRQRVASNEETHYALVSGLQQGNVSQWARIENIRVAQTARRLEVLPYVVSSVHRGPSEPGDPFFDGTAADARVGADLSYGLGAAFTLDATINPDFGQVEADPAVINLSAFETFFQERRPFFVEDARIFDFSLSGGTNQLFYSRRVGRAPQGASRNEPDAATFTDVPANATILGAAKLAGRTEGGLSIGALAAVTGREHGEALLPGDVRHDFPVEPRTQYGTASVVQDFRGGASQVGLLGTVMHRELPGDGSFDWLSSNALSGGVKFNHQWSNRAWAVFGYYAGSHVRGSPDAITNIQRSSVHYFQRPDATRFSLDPTAKSLTGRDWRITLAKQNGEHWTGSVWAAEVTKGFEVNDVGFSTRSEVLDGGVAVGYREIRPGRIFRNYNVGLRTFHNWSHDALDDVWSAESWQNARTGGNYGFNANGQFLSYWSVGFNVGYGIQQMSRRQTRGGPMMVLPSGLNLNFNLSTDRRKALSFFAFVGLNDARRGIGGGRTFELEMQLRPNDNLTVSLSPRYSVSRSGDQYVTSTGTLPYAPTYGTRYLFADLEQRNFSMETRVDWIFSPTLSLQLYAQPLLSSGDYLTYKQLAAPRTYDFVELAPTVAGPDELALDFDADGTPDYTFDDRDFNVRSLIGNAVLRWEYRPGSTVFVVWQRTQDDEADIGDFDLSRDVGRMFRADADDRFIVKVSYWMGL